MLAVTRVDGLNLVTGQQAALHQPGYVVHGHASTTIDGWRKDLGQVASFVFTTPRHSYAARTGRPRVVGMIGVAMFRERRRPAHASDRPASAVARRRLSARLVAPQRGDRHGRDALRD